MEPSEAIERLCAFAGRGACTDAERRAAVWLRDDLRARGHEAELRTHWTRPNWAAAVALATFLGAGGSLLATAVPLGGLIAAALGALGLAVEATGRVSPLRWIGRRRATQNVFAPGADPDRIELLIAARYDAPRRGLVLNDRWRRFAVRIRSVRAVLAGCCAVVALCAAARLHGTDGTWVGIAQLVPTVALIAALAASLDIALSEFSPGADTASAAAAALAVHEELTRELPAELEPALLLIGAGEPGTRTLREHLRGADPRSIVLVELGPCTEGAVGWSARHDQLKAAATRAAEALELPPARRPRGVKGARRLPSVRIACLDARGRVPRSHQPDDLPEHVLPDASGAAVDLALGISDALDAELANRTRDAAAA
jgi:hypothetical protein